MGASEAGIEVHTDPSAARQIDALPDEIVRALTQLVGDGIIVTDARVDQPGPTIRFVNDAVTQLTGYSREELIGTSPRIFQGPSTDATELRRIREHLERGDAVRAELVNVHKDGREVIIELEITPVRAGDDGHVTSFVAVQRDVTEQRLSTRWFRALVEHTAELISISAPDGRVTYVSPSVEWMLGWRPDQILGRTGAEFVHPDDAPRLVSGLRAKSERDGSNPPVEFRFRAADGSWRWLEAVTTNLLDEPAVRGMVVNARDITARKQIEDELRHAQKLDAIGRLAGGVAHDFNNLLQVIEGHAELAIQCTEQSEDPTEHLRTVLAAVSKAKVLTKRLVSISRADGSESHAVRLDDVVADSVELLRRVVGTDIELVADLGAGDTHVVINPDQLGQVVMNLAINARGAMAAGGTLTVRTAPAQRQVGRQLGRRDLDGEAYAVVTVADTGTGIAPEDLPHVFEPFFTTRSDEGGTGLGLAIVAGIVHQVGGAVDVVSEVDRGTTFTIHLPAVV